MASGILLVDKPGGMTSHDVVARVRRAIGTRKVGHAGTLDPMATGLLLIGVNDATRLLHYLVGLGKSYTATIRLGVSTTTDDAEGDVVASIDASEISDEQISTRMGELTGDIQQVPNTFSAIKVDGKRAYDLARRGEDVALKARSVTVSRFDVLDVRREAAVIDLDVVVDCSSGTYVRALARDLGSALGVGGHLTVLRRSSIGAFSVDEASGVEQLSPEALLPSAEVAAAVLGQLDVSAEEARDLRHGKRLLGASARVHGERAAAIAPDGALIGVVEKRGADLKSAMNMPEPQPGAEEE